MPTTWWQRRKLAAVLQLQLLQVCKFTDVVRQHRQCCSLLHCEPNQALHFFQPPPLTKGVKPLAASEIQPQLPSLRLLFKTLERSLKVSLLGSLVAGRFRKHASETFVDS